MPKIELFNEDCMDVMARYPDSYFDLACVDPPYGINVNTMNMGSRKTVKPDKKNGIAKYQNKIISMSLNE